MSIWFQKDCEDFVKQLKGNMMAHLGIEIVELGDDYIKGKMPIDHRTTQPAGLLHGGASVVLAESLTIQEARKKARDAASKIIVLT